MINATAKRNFARMMRKRMGRAWVKSAGPVCYDIKDPVTINFCVTFFIDYLRNH